VHQPKQDEADETQAFAGSPPSFDPYHKWLGIPPVDQPPNHYRLLGISLFESDQDVIAHAAEQRLAHVRSFQIGKHSDESQRLLKEISVARVCLLNADKKAEYDARLQAALGAPAAVVPSPPRCPAQAPIAPIESPVVLSGAMLGQKSARGRANRSRTTKSAPVEFLKIIAGGIVGLGMAYCLLLFVFRIDMLDRLSGRRTAEPRKTVKQSTVPPPTTTAASTAVVLPEKTDVGKPATGSDSLSVVTQPPTRPSPPAPPPSKPEPVIEYHIWEWHPAGAKPFRLKFYVNGTVSHADRQSGQPKFTWRKTRDKLILRWPNEDWVDTMRISPNGRSMRGANQYGRQISAKLIGTNLDKP
jgi:hypothetical protein